MLVTGRPVSVPRARPGATLVLSKSQGKKENISSICTLVAPEPCVEAAVFGVGGTGFGSD